MTARTLVGIVTFNRAGILPRAIASALAQGSQPDVEVIDDASTDGTPQLSTTYPGVRWVRRPSNQGHISARNEFMLHRSAYDYFVSLDDDAWFLSGDEVSLAIGYLESHPKVAAVAFDILSPDRPQPVGRQDPEPAALFVGCGHALRLAALAVVGGYEHTPGTYGCEEKDLCLRLMDAGYEIVRMPGVHVWHEKTPVARQLPAQHRSGVCNDMVVTLRRTPGHLVLPALLVKLHRHVRFGWRHRLLWPCLQGLWLFLLWFPAAWRTRRPVRPETIRRFLRLSHA